MVVKNSLERESQSSHHLEKADSTRNGTLLEMPTPPEHMSGKSSGSIEQHLHQFQDAALEFHKRQNPNYDGLVALKNQVNQINEIKNPDERAAVVSAIVKDKQAGSLLELSTDGTLSVIPAMRELLAKHAEKMVSVDSKKFMRDIDTFIHRSSLSTDKVEKTLNHMIEMLEKPSELNFAKLDHKQFSGEAAQQHDAAQKYNTARGEELKLLAAKGFAHHLADPKTLWIGHHYTCNVTSAEGILLERFPDKAADMLKQALQRGKVVDHGPDGKTLQGPDGKPREIDVNPQSFAPLGREERTWPPDDHSRTFDSKVIVHCLMNRIGAHLAHQLTYWEENGAKADETDPGPSFWTDKGGKRLKYDDEVFGKHSCVPAWLLGAEVYRLTGEKDNIVVESGAYDREYSRNDGQWSNRYGLRYDDFKDIDGLNYDECVKRVDADKADAFMLERAAEGRLPVVFAGSSVMLSNLMPKGGERLKPSKFEKVEDPMGTHSDHYFLVYVKDGKIGITNNWGRGANEGYPVTAAELKTIISPDDELLELALRQQPDWGKQHQEDEALSLYLDDRLHRLGKPKRHKTHTRHNGH